MLCYKKKTAYEIGKNLVNIMFEGAGFEVIDLGVQVAPEKFVDAIKEHQPDIAGVSAFLTTTMPMFKANINALEKSGLRDQVIVMVGGAPVTAGDAGAGGAGAEAPHGAAPPGVGSGVGETSGDCRPVTVKNGRHRSGAAVLHHRR